MGFYKCVDNTAHPQLKVGDVYEANKVGEYYIIEGFTRIILTNEEVEEVYMDYVHDVYDNDIYKGILYYDMDAEDYMWKLSGDDNVYPQWYFSSLKRDMTVEEDEEEYDEDDYDNYTFIDLITLGEDGDIFTNGSSTIKKIGDVFVFDFPNNQITVSEWSQWKKKKPMAVDVAEAMIHLLNGKVIESVLSGERYSLNDIDGNNYDSIELEEIKNKWILIED